MMASMMRSFLFCLAGLFCGGIIGFLVANNSAPVTAVAPAPARQSNGVAPPLDPEQTSGELPANHPPLDAGGGQPSNPAASVPEVQQAMDAADRNPKDYEAQMSAAAAFYQNNAKDKAEIYLKRALAVKPNDPDALTGLGDVQYDREDYASAQATYEKVLKLKKDPNVQTDLGNTFFKRKQFDRAISEYRKAVAIAPQHEKAWQNIAAAAIQKGDQQTAREAVDKLAAINPQNPALASFRQSLSQ
jgi:tetratricopeptide (TPR) repeat protein